MISKIKKKIDKELIKFIGDIDKLYSLSKISPLLFKNIKDFISRPGKRIRPILFVIGYLGLTKRAAPGLHRAALAIELLHDFMLVHDDIIDKSSLRRGKPAIHTLLNSYLRKYKNIKFRGEDLAIVIGDIMYALCLHAFLAIKEDTNRKQMALMKFIKAAIYTTSGEFIELLSATKNLNQLSKRHIYNIYDLKTAYYTFACPLSTGAILAGANRKQVNYLYRCGIYLGRAFQIKDDILGMFADEKKLGKSILSDLQEAKKTILIWYAYKNAIKKDKKQIKIILSRKQVKKTDLLTMRKIITDSGALTFANKEIFKLIKAAQSLLKRSTMNRKYKNCLCDYSRNLLIS